ncbi:2Fe-2S iron-sulfur cluster-binding protein [Azomonas macrocytogenes]|uniref:Ferredoxin n=1 Tax=Azomonas macrocytogenes TaxID=69962 RepID=A0A839T148_AZOMA|nr:2Fe-2S iron-sulfur cluster-binding protein [Azomonas macrocytogenes]MBB3102124.1 ferredoxin [Azomonas macrocytogenes]
MAKAELTFKDINKTVSVTTGTRVIEVSEKENSGIVYGCREGDCATCIMDVLDGWENLSQPSVVEDRILRENAAGRHQRLACQAQILGGRVVVKPA